MRMQFYGPDELAVILLAQAQKLNLALTDDGALKLRAAPGGHLVLRGVCCVVSAILPPLRALIRLMRHWQIKPCCALMSMSKGLTIWIGAISIGPWWNIMVGDRSVLKRWLPCLAEQRDMLEEVIEPYLMQTRLTMRTTRRGLFITHWLGLFGADAAGL